MEETNQTGIRAWLNRHPVIAVASIVIILGLVFYLTHRPPPAPQAWFTTDDGATYFAHDYQVPPFTSGGKEAVQAWVYTCDAGQTRFVGYLMRFTPEGKEAMEKLLADRRAHHSSGPLSFPPGVQVKKPGEGNWVERASQSTRGGGPSIDRAKRIEDAIRAGVDPRTASEMGADPYEQITHVTCPGGQGKPTIADP